jgi:hypothetical protein
VALLGLQGVAGGVTGIGFLVATFAGKPADRATSVFLSVLFIMFGLTLLAMARGLQRGRDWPRTPALLAQFFGLVVAWNQRTTLSAVAVVLAVVCLATAAAVLRRPAVG